MVNKKRIVEIPEDGIIRIPVMDGKDVVGQRCFDLDFLPTVDAVEVIRCIDCKSSREPDVKEKEYLSDGVIICTNCKLAEVYDVPVFSEDFCSYGERRVEE